MNRLLEIGFEPSGHWLIEGGRIRVELTRHAAQQNVLYAFVCDGEVKYVGKTVRSLSERMSGYKNPGSSQTTNINVHRRIEDLLAQGVAVEILVLPDSGLLHYGPFHLNLAAGLEDDIIRVVAPEWNGGAKEQPAVWTDQPVGSAREDPLAGSFDFTLQATYYRTGFFNVGVAAQEFLGADGEMIELFRGNELQPILGTINRRANLNGTPRVMGGTGLRDWFQTQASVMDRIHVEVYAPTSIRLTVLPR